MIDGDRLDPVDDVLEDEPMPDLAGHVPREPRVWGGLPTLRKNEPRRERTRSAASENERIQLM